MTLEIQARKRLQEILRRAYREKETLGAGEIDRQDIMDQIQKRSRLRPPTSSFSENFERFVWRLAPVVCLSIFLLIALTSVIPALDFWHNNGRAGFPDGEGEEFRLEQLFEA